MILYRDGVVFFSDVETFLASDQSIKIAALACEVDGDVSMPALRDVLRVDAVVEGWRCGPLRAEVVHVAQRRIGLHLSDDAIEQLKQLMAQLRRRQRRLTEVFRETATRERATHGRERPESDTLPGTRSMDRPPQTGPFGSIDDLTNSTLVLSGVLRGRLSLGTLADLFRSDPVETIARHTSLLAVFRFLAQQHASGALTLRNPAFTKTVWFKHGTILAVQVSPLKEDEMLGQILIKAHWVSPQDLGNALRWAREKNIGVGRTLVESGRLTSDQLDKALAHQNYRRLQDLFSWEGARFDFDSDEKPPPPPYHAMAVTRLHYEIALELLREARMDQLNLLLKAFEDCYPVLSPDAPADRLKKLLPNEKTRHVCQQIFDGKRIVRRTIAASQLGRTKTLRLLLFLQAAGVLAMRPDPALPATRELVDERLRSLQVQDFFQRLNLSYLAQADEVEPALGRRLSSFASGSVFFRVNPEASAQIDTLLRQAGRALQHGPTRTKHRESVLGPSGLTTFSQLLTDELELARAQGESGRVHRLEQIQQELGG